MSRPTTPPHSDALASRSARGAALVAAFIAALDVTACASRDADRFSASQDADGAHRLADGGVYASTLHAPRQLVSILGTTRNLQGQPVEIRCATCHDLLVPPPALPDRASSLGGPHAGLRFDHGGNACAACHDPTRFDRLRLATGETIPMTGALRLCAQCHGTQYRNYTHGSHGGMTGHWDLRSGPRVRNHCVDCHDPHTPRYPSFRPMPPPLDAPARVETRHG